METIKKNASGHEGEAPVIVFSQRKAALTLYVHSNTGKGSQLLDELRECKVSKACKYVRKPADINKGVLKEI